MASDPFRFDPAVDPAFVLANKIELVDALTGGGRVEPPEVSRFARERVSVRPAVRVSGLEASERGPGPTGQHTLGLSSLVDWRASDGAAIGSPPARRTIASGIRRAGGSVDVSGTPSRVDGRRL